MTGGLCECMAKDSKLTLRHVAFGSRQTRGNKTCLHLHLGEGYTGNWAINKHRHLCWGMCFTWGTDYFGLKFILSYDGTNLEIMRLQMCLMCWKMAIVHRNNNFLIDDDY